MRFMVGHGWILDLMGLKWLLKKCWMKWIQKLLMRPGKVFFTESASGCSERLGKRVCSERYCVAKM